MSDCIWAPWRLPYIVSSKEESKSGCFLCHGRDSGNDRINLLLLRAPHALVMLNRYPYTNGHLLVAPAAHKAALAELSDEEGLACLRVITQMIEVLERILHPHGYNIGLNLGKAAGAGLPGHLHWHVVPRWEGDTNFMPALAGVKVIPQALEQLYNEIIFCLTAG